MSFKLPSTQVLGSRPSFHRQHQARCAICCISKQGSPINSHPRNSFPCAQQSFSIRNRHLLWSNNLVKPGQTQHHPQLGQTTARSTRSNKSQRAAAQASGPNDATDFNFITGFSDSQENIKGMLEVWGVDDSLFYAIALTHPFIMLSDENDLFVRIMSLCDDDLQLSTRQIRSILHRCPEFLLSEGPAMQNLSDWLLTIGVEDKATVGRLVASCPQLLNFDIDELQKRAEWLIDAGVSYSQLPAVIEKCPQILATDTTEMKARTDFLLQTAGLPGSNLGMLILQFPQMLATPEEKDPLHLLVEDVMDSAESPEECVEGIEKVFAECGRMLDKNLYWKVIAAAQQHSEDNDSDDDEDNNNGNGNLTIRHFSDYQ